MTHLREDEIKLKKYGGFNNDDPLVIQVNTIQQPDPIVMAIQDQGTQIRNQYPDGNISRLNWKTSLTCYMCGEKENLARECPHTAYATVSHP